MNRQLKKGLIKSVPILCLSFILFSGVNCKNNGALKTKELSTLTILEEGSEWWLHGGNDLFGHWLYFQSMAQQNTEGDMEGVLAERWEHSEDYSEWTYFLRKNIRWHDGVPFTAYDVAFSIDLLKHPDVLERSPGDSYTVIDDHTIRIRYDEPWYSPDDWFTYFPKHILENLDPKGFWSWDFWLQPVGNGPYRYVRRVPKTMVELEANPDYFKDQPKIEKIILKFGGNPIIELLSGNVQASAISQEDIPKLKSDGRFNFYYTWEGKLTAIFWNHKHHFLSESEVRKALTLALNRSDLFEALYIQDHYPVDVIYTPDQWKRGEVPEGLPYDPESAKRLLFEAGFSDSDNDGILDREGEPFRFTALLEGGGGQFAYSAVIAQNAFRQIGVQMDISYLPSAIMRPKVLQGDFDAFFYKASIMPEANLKIFGDESFVEPPFRGWIGIQHIPILSLLTEATRVAKPEQIDAAYRELWKVFQAEIPLTYLFPQVHTFAVDKRVYGLSSPYRAAPIMFLEHLWIEEEDKN